MGTGDTNGATAAVSSAASSSFGWFCVCSFFGGEVTVLASPFPSFLVPMANGVGSGEDHGNQEEGGKVVVVVVVVVLVVVLVMVLVVVDVDVGVTPLGSKKNGIDLEERRGVVSAPSAIAASAGRVGWEARGATARSSVSRSCSGTAVWGGRGDGGRGGGVGGGREEGPWDAGVCTDKEDGEGEGGGMETFGGVGGLSSAAPSILFSFVRRPLRLFVDVRRSMSVFPRVTWSSSHIKDSSEASSSPNRSGVGERRGGRQGRRGGSHSDPSRRGASSSSTSVGGGTHRGTRKRGGERDAGGGEGGGMPGRTPAAVGGGGDGGGGSGPPLGESSADFFTGAATTAGGDAVSRGGRRSAMDSRGTPATVGEMALAPSRRGRGGKAAWKRKSDDEEEAAEVKGGVSGVFLSLSSSGRKKGGAIPPFGGVQAIVSACGVGGNEYMTSDFSFGVCSSGVARCCSFSFCCRNASCIGAVKYPS